RPILWCNHPRLLAPGRGPAMDDTRYSLLARARGGDQAAWNRFTDLYRPLIIGWLRRHGLEHHDAEDLAQEVLVSGARHLADCAPWGPRGAFRRWLRTITVNRTRDFWKARQVRPAAPGGSALLEMADRLEDPDSELARQWDEEHDRYVLRCLLDMVA